MHFPGRRACCKSLLIKVWKRSETMKHEAPEVGKIHKTGTWSRLGKSWSGSWRPGRDFLAISAHVGAKMGAKWAKLGPSWQQGATKMGHDSAKLAILASTWEVLGCTVQYESQWLTLSGERSEPIRSWLTAHSK